MSDAIAPRPCVLICQSRTCKKQGAVAVLEAFNKIPLDHWTVLASPCLGQCGNGPMVLVLPDEVWYWRVRVDEVAAIADSHLLKGNPIRAMLYPVMHP